MELPVSIKHCMFSSATLIVIVGITGFSTLTLAMMWLFVSFAEMFFSGGSLDSASVTSRISLGG